jgi:predicted unusual protein kinase regulating ubiquinone biosynthesis (AarF/ABC1/UbiB family)
MSSVSTVILTGHSRQTGKITTNRKRIKKRQRERGQVREKRDADRDESSPTNEAASSKNSEVMKYFTLPTEYAFVGRALSQMGGVGKTLDPDFDFISSAAPWIYEIKGPSKFIREKAEKWLSDACQKVESFFSGTAGRDVDRTDTAKR